MDTNLRDSGIDIIGKVSIGTHIAHMYSSKAEFFDVCAPYIQSGLENNELCLWIYSQNTSYEEITSTLSKYIENLDKYLESEQLIIIPYTKWYIENEDFNEIRVNRQWNKLIDYSINQGYKGLRAVADTSWLDKKYLRSFEQYEYNLNKIISELPFIAICLYDSNKLDILEIANVIKNHNYIITKHENQLEIIKNVELLIKNKQLEESERKYRRLIRLLPDSVFIHDKKRIFYCNDSASHLLEFNNKDKLFGKSMLDLVPSESKNNFIAFINKALSESNGTNYFQSKFICFSGENKNIEIVSTKYNFHGYPALLSVVRDVSPFSKITKLERDIEEKKDLLNSRLEYDKMKTEFFSNISHELKTPLNVIFATIQLLKSQKNKAFQNNNQDKYLKTMQKNCFRLLRLLNNIIDITKIDSNYFDVNLQNYDIVSLIENITHSVVDYAKKKDITITIDTNTEEKIIALDPDIIERIVLNLLSNAIKFTQEGGNIWVSIFDHGEKIRFSVKDNGIGIPLEKQESIFNRFQQVDNSTTRQNEGSGIGLSLVKALVEKHEGKVILNSELGKGSEFIIEIPCNTSIELDSHPTLCHEHSYHNCVESIKIELSDIYS